MVIGRVAFVIVAASIGIETLSATRVNAQTSSARFVTVEQSGDELKADGVLARRLGKQLIGDPEKLPYEAVINVLLDDTRGDAPLARKGGVVARVTPYAFVVAEMRGAKMELLATCLSRYTKRTIVNAFVVVPEAAFKGTMPTLDQVLDHMKALSDAELPARFIYHNKLSTSSYFLPSLIFRAHRVFGLDDRTSNPAGVTMIVVERNTSEKSSELIRAVATQAGSKRR